MYLFIHFHEHLLTYRLMHPRKAGDATQAAATHSTSGAKTAGSACPGCELLTYTAFQGWHTANENFLQNLTVVERGGKEGVVRVKGEMQCFPGDHCISQDIFTARARLAGATVPSPRTAPGNTLDARSFLGDGFTSQHCKARPRPASRCPAQWRRSWANSHPGTRNLTPTHSARRVEQGRAKARWCCLSRAHRVASAGSGAWRASSRVRPGPSADSWAGKRKYQAVEKAEPTAPPPPPPPITGGFRAPPMGRGCSAGAPPPLGARSSAKPLDPP